MIGNFFRNTQESQVTDLAFLIMAFFGFSNGKELITKMFHSTRNVHYGTPLSVTARSVSNNLNYCYWK
jgi:hypothetical protein